MASIKTSSAAQKSLSQPLYSKMEVQCADPDLKREALSELFDHCMAPISTLPPATRCLSFNGSRTRPLSAAPLLDLDLSPSSFLPSSPESGARSVVMSPVMPANEAGPYFNTQHASCDFAQDKEEQEQEQEECAAVGTFASLRRRLYGGDLHPEAAASVSSLHRD
ncbi:hypothetical protein GQ54DRAFT_299565 [Martensiomyces pterosporus]|nr:hypothetical protein GQ54DRAFT_299565 [Martensiomyces pterosporus]